MKLSDIEIGTIVNFLNEGGYVLDFSTALIPQHILLEINLKY